MSEATVRPAPPAVVRPDLPLWIVATMSCVAQFMVVLDGTIVTVALPAMKDALQLSTTGQQWVVSGYLITLGGLLLLAARAGDLIGRRRVFLFGAVVFTAASLVGGLATGPVMLLGSRIVQGIGAAALAPSSLSLITATHTDERTRQRALAVWSVMAAAAGLVGVVAGGLLTSALGWRWVLFVNVPIGIGLIVAAAAFLLPASSTGPRTRLDLTGALSVTVGVGALTYGLSQASSAGWGSPEVVTALVVAALVAVGFVLNEARSPHPLIPLSLFRSRSLQVGNVLMLCLGAVMTSATFFLSLYLQQALGYSPLRAGLSLLPMTIVLIVGGLGSRRLVPVLGLRTMLVAGAVVAAVGTGWLAWLPSYPAYLTHLLGPTLVAGVGLSAMLLGVTLTGTKDVAARDAGAAAGLLNSSRQVGGAIGLAVLVTVAALAAAGAGASTGHLEALVHGYRVAFLVNAGILLVAGLAALALPAAPRPR